MSKKTRTIVSLLLVVVIALAFGFGYLFGRSSSAGMRAGLDIVGEAWNIILTEHVDRDQFDDEKLRGAAIEGMLDSLDDPYASYLDAEYFELALTGLEGEFDGIGAYVTVEDDQITIIAPIAGSPAEQAGIRAGDIILEINGQPVADMSLAEAVIEIRGPRGTAVRLLVLHEGETEPEEIEVIRNTVEVPTVRFEMKGDIAYINITDFTERTGEEMAETMQDLTGQNASGIILDLRGNPGGPVDTVIEVASYFLHEGIVLKIKYPGEETTTLYVENNTPVTDLPMVVLVDEGSASGSEVLAGALQDHSRATIAGTTTYGKGSVNMLRQLDDGSGIYITVARWFTPNDRLIEGEGIAPDIELELTGEDTIDWALDYLTSRE